MSRIMTAKKLQELMYIHTRAVQDLTNRFMANKGDIETECQRVGMLNRIKDLEAQMRGIDDTDLRALAEALPPLTTPPTVSSTVLEQLDKHFSEEVMAAMQAELGGEYEAACQHHLNTAAIRYVRSLLSA